MGGRKEWRGKAVAGAGIRRRAQDSLGGAISRASADLPPGFRDSRRASASGVASHRASRLSLLLVLPAACRAPVRRRLCSSASLQGTRRASASCRGPVGFPSASLQGPVRLPSLLLPAAAPSPQGQCPPLLAAPSSRSLLHPLLLSPAPLPCSG